MNEGSHFASGVNEAQRSQTTCPGSHRQGQEEYWKLVTLNTDSTPAVSSTAGPGGAQRETHVGTRQREGSQVRRGGEVRCKEAGSHVVHLGPSGPGTWGLVASVKEDMGLVTW